LQDAWWVVVRVVIGIVVVVALVNAASHHRPAPAPCPPKACTLHPHAPHKAAGHG